MDEMIQAGNTAAGLFLVALSCAFGADSLPNPYPNVVFPDDAGVVNVREAYGAKGDGISDDTAALQRAFDELRGQNRTLYFPNGTYLVSAPVGIFGGKAHSRDRFVHLQGQSRDGVVIRLKDRTKERRQADPALVEAGVLEGY